jgi:hypothetical protein
MNTSSTTQTNTETTGFRTQQKRGNGYTGRGRGGGYGGKFRGRGGSFQRGGANAGTGANRYNRYKKADPADGAGSAADANVGADAENQTATAAPARQYPTEPNFAVTKNGALGLYNVTRRPVIFYANQWEGISEMIQNGALSRALEENAGRLRRPSKKEEDEGEGADASVHEESAGTKA